MGKLLWRNRKNYFKMYDTTKPYTKRILEILRKHGHKTENPASTDGIGTKGIYHWKARIYPEINSARRAVLDGLAMNLNDALVGRFMVEVLNNHIMVPEEDVDFILNIVENIASECDKRNIRIASGETSIHNDMRGLEISVNVSGKYVKQGDNYSKPDDVLIGLQSSGWMSNGFTKFRDIFGTKHSRKYLEELTTPTFIYYDDVLPLIEKFDIHGMCHVTGGAYTKLRNLLGENDALIKRNHRLKPQEIFYRLYRRGVSDEEMYKTFNCGVGFIMSVSNEDKEEIIQNLLGKEYDVDIIGKISKGTGKVRIESMFSDAEVVL